MPEYLASYIKSLWRHWEKRLTGGSLVALAAIIVFTGNTIAEGVGVGLLGATFLAASFGAWREEHRNSNVATQKLAVLKQAAVGRTPRIFEVNPGRPTAPTTMLILKAQVFTPDTTAFPAGWSAVVALPGGQSAVLTGGRPVPEDHRFPEGQMSWLSLAFDFGGPAPHWVTDGSGRITS